MTVPTTATTAEERGPSTTSTVTVGAWMTTKEIEGLWMISTVAMTTKVVTKEREGPSLTPQVVSAFSTRQGQVYLDKVRCI